MDGEPQKEAKSGARVRHVNHVDLGTRRITPADLIEIDRALPGGLFSDKDWEIRDELGLHEGRNIDELLQGVIWESVRYFSLRATSPMNSDGLWAGSLSLVVKLYSAEMWHRYDYDSDLPARQRASRAVQTIFENLQSSQYQNTFAATRTEVATMGAVAPEVAVGEVTVSEAVAKAPDRLREPDPEPRAPEPEPKAVPVTVAERQSPRQVPEPEAPQHRWWDPRRKPDSLLDWIFLTAAGGAVAVAIVAAVVAVVLKVT